MSDDSFKSYLDEQMESAEFRQAYEDSEREIAQECFCHLGSVCGEACDSRHHEGCILSKPDQRSTNSDAKRG